ncbi:MAG TPA: 16S rRNA (adenine(1518)-N(6)/adenine(1519)-N(6))-dimethyltransferase RsmA [Catalimonadaceae bacterium]|nr:16S rRNA (adenine(1518)-N(6)/adenine(1519)-N(6))-dimethyltransferase RsmA [Catalimonadaceae bacterium]
MSVRPKKNLGQHFLKDQGIARDIVDLFTGFGQPEILIEIGPGTGVLTQHLLEPKPWKFRASDVDGESIEYLKRHFPLHQEKFILEDFLRMDPKAMGFSRLAVIGNFPYNISSQIFFHILEMESEVTEVVCMLQKEVAQRIASGPGSKEYGILSVLLQSLYTIKYAFTVGAHVFDPPPKVQSGVIRLELIEGKVLPCRFSNLQKLVKQAFNMRRKTLRNALKPMGIPESLAQHPWMDKRAEQLSVSEFEEMTAIYEAEGKLRK